MQEANHFERPEAQLSTSRLIEELDNLRAVNRGLVRDLAQMIEYRDGWRNATEQALRRAEYAERALKGFELMAAVSSGVA